MTTIRSHNQFNTTIYDYSDRYRGIEGERRVIFMNPADIEKLGLKAGQVVNLTSHFDDGERHAYRFIVVPYPIPRDCAATYFPEANPLVPLGSVAEKSKTPTSKSIVITIQPTAETAGNLTIVMEIEAFILIGGRSSRMGSDKALLEIRRRHACRTSWTATALAKHFAGAHGDACRGGCTEQFSDLPVIIDV